LTPELGIDPKTVAKWRKQAIAEDRKTAPTKPRSTVFAEAEAAIVVAFRRQNNAVAASSMDPDPKTWGL
jgi:transposase-like protein